MSDFEILGQIECCSDTICVDCLDLSENKKVVSDMVKELVSAYFKTNMLDKKELAIHYSHLIADIVSMFSTKQAIKDKLKFDDKRIVDDSNKWFIVANMVETLLNYYTIYSM